MLYRFFTLCLLALFTMPVAAQSLAKVSIYVTVDWEGFSLSDENIQEMRGFRSRYPHIPMLHLLNPVYFLRPGANAADIENRIRSTLLPVDGIGLHIHPWKSLVRHCGLAYSSEPAFATLNEDCLDGECGYTVSLEHGYTETELNQLVACSTSVLEKHGFGRPKSFRAGGWQFGPKLAAALKQNSYTMDSSRTVAGILTSRWGGDSGLVKLVRQLHEGASTLDQPFELLPGLMEYPNNGSLADYTSAQKILEIFRELIANGKSVLVLGFHQETAFDYLHRLEDAIPLLEQEAKAAGISIEWATYPETKSQ